MGEIEELRKELEGFSTKAVPANAAEEGLVLSSQMQRVMDEMARSGQPAFDWDLLKPFLSFCLRVSLAKFRKEHPGTDPRPSSTGGTSLSSELNKATTEEHITRLLTAIQLFHGAPFTLQRICELIVEPGKYYKSVSKLLFGLEKLLSVSSVLDIAEPNPFHSSSSSTKTSSNMSEQTLMETEQDEIPASNNEEKDSNMVDTERIQTEASDKEEGTAAMEEDESADAGAGL